MPALIGDGEQQNFAAFFAVADGEDTHSRGRGGQGAAVGIGFGGVHKLARRAGDSAQKMERRWDSRRLGQVGNPGREKVFVTRGRGRWPQPSRAQACREPDWLVPLLKRNQLATGTAAK